jgi:predicted MPP superfamily phosphohydrolase
MPFIILLVLIIMLALYMLFEAGWLKVEKLDFSRDGNGLKIVHLSDLHIYLARVSAARVRKVIKAENPDIILISGDYIDKPLHASQFLQYLSVLCKGYRTVLCLGNHDLRAFGTNRLGLENFIHEIEALKVEVLRNENIVIEKHGKKYNIIGIDDLHQGQPDIEKALAGCVPDAPKISITHNPDLALHIPGKIVDYMFCGHFHGGQIWMPFNLEFFLLRKDQLCRMGIKRGYKKINDIKVYMNRGLGNVVVPMRLFSRPEILICTIP